MANKRKTTTAIVAGVTAVALLLGGTFAWTSISQQARNEAIVDINPGGRLHDDFDGRNKDVYVENFGDETTGVPIYARIRLDQYFEVGQDAGINKEGDNRKVDVKIGGDINLVSTWDTYEPVLDESGNIDFDALQANGNWTWDMGNDDTNKPYYMPTFNKNKDSLAADINGTYEGKTTGDIVHYDDYVKYDATSTVTGIEVYDWDDENAEEEENPSITTDETTPRDSANVYHKENQTHTAQQIDSAATVITMKQWIDNYGSQPGPYWVYDTDGWAYWAQAIEPGKTTGLLLDSINMSKVPDDNYYYGINVVGQFATKGDIYQFEDMSPEAEELFGIVSGSEAGLVINGADTVNIGESATFTATRMALGGEAVSQPAGFTWTATATDADGQAIEGVSITDGVLTTESTVPHGTEITITATASEAATLAEGDETVTEALTASKTVTALGSLKLTAKNNLTSYQIGTGATENFTAQINGGSADLGTLTWTVEDGDGNALTETTITDGNLNIGAAELATNIVVTATYKSDDGEVEFSGTYEILRSNEIATYENYSEDTQAVALMTRNDSTLDSGDSAYTLTFVRVKDNFTFAEYTYDETAYSYTASDNTSSYTYNGKAIEYAFTGLEDYDINTTALSVFWQNDSYTNLITDVVVANEVKTTVSWGLFANMANLETVDVAKLNTSKWNSAMSMFYGSSKLKTITGLANWDMSDCIGLGWTFSGCSSLETIDGISDWDLSSTRLFMNTFENCTSLKTLDLSKWGEAGVNYTSMFSGCSVLESVGDISNWKTDDAQTTMKEMFMNCEKLTVDCSAWDVSNVGEHDNFATNAPGVTLPTAWQ